MLELIIVYTSNQKESEHKAMSAFIVSQAHINALVNFPGNTETYYFNNKAQSLSDRKRIGQILINENFRSVNARYAEQNTPESFTLSLSKKQYSAVQIIKACHCLDYQSCETDDWETTEAHAIIKAIESIAINKLPGYDEAAWEIR